MRRALPLVFLLVAIAASCGGDKASGSPVIIRTPTAQGNSPGITGTAAPLATETPASGTSTSAVDATPTVPTGVTAEPTPGDDGSILVTCGDTLAPLDKQHRLPADCVPADLVTIPDAYSYAGPHEMVAEAADAMIELIDAAAADGVYVYVISAYRSYDHQVSTYNWHVATYGEEYASRVSARPGHSEHQLGTTADVVSASAGYVLENFPGTPEAAWIAANATRFGFVVSYPEGLESVTGYAFEPWHIRYVGRDVAASVAASGLTLGRYLLGAR